MVRVTIRINYKLAINGYSLKNVKMATAIKGDLEMMTELSAWSCVSITSMAFPAKTTPL